MERYRLISLAMGAWKWGFPKGQRLGIQSYVPRKLKNGKIVWRSARFLCDGLTGKNHKNYMERYGLTFNDQGSLHNVPLNEQELRAYKLENIMKKIKKERI